jgi:2-phospho-L-lactate guanylyltransferase (CobY/MobA/RfbA family)
LAEARRLGLATRVERSPALSWDVDLPEDLKAL